MSGFNVYPAEVETVLLEHPAIVEAAVVGVPDARSGEAVLAYLVAAAGSSLSQDEVIAWCSARLARYKCPTAVELVDALPHGVAGKLLRRALRGQP